MGDVRGAAGPGRAAEQHATVAIRDDHGLDRVLPALAGDERLPVLAPEGRAADPDLGAVDDAGLAFGTKMVDDIGQGSQPKTRCHRASALSQQRSHLADSPRDRGAFHAEPAGQHVMRDSVT